MQKSEPVKNAKEKKKKVLDLDLVNNLPLSTKVCINLKYLVTQQPTRSCLLLKKYHSTRTTKLTPTKNNINLLYDEKKKQKKIIMIKFT